MTHFRPIADEPDLKCQMCNYYPANLYLFENLTAYPNCGDQTCLSSWYWDHPIALMEVERMIQEDYETFERAPIPSTPTPGHRLP